MEYFAGNLDLAVIGAGHAGVEAALAAARLGVKTTLFTISLDAVSNMPCNPSIGGTAKGHLVREIDALGGEMAKAADEVFLQSRMLNRGKGPAVHSLRVQADRVLYHQRMKQTLERQPGLSVKQAEIVEVRLDSGGALSHIVTALGAVYAVKAAILCTGTFLGAKIFVGDTVTPSGPDGLLPANRLGLCLTELGFPLRRFKTGTPARVHKNSIDFSKLEVQPGDEPVVPFSFSTNTPLQNRVVCHIAYTNERTHQIIRENIHRSPLYAGKIEGIGTRYCPSIEDKVMRFPDRTRHQIFVEPMGLSTSEMYLQGMSSSLPEDVQIALYRSIPGFEKLEIMRTAYAIEYDCVDPLALKPTLEFLDYPGLYGAGQFNGTSGYEEAAAQGLVAGINAANKLLGKTEIVLERGGSYIGTLIDDLVTKGCMDPYRMMTSRSEYRLLLRQDNADLRLTPLGREIGLISDERWQMFHMKQAQIATEKQRVERATIVASGELNALLAEKGTGAVAGGVKLADLLRRPQLQYADLAPFDLQRPPLPGDITEQVEITVKYEGYIRKQAQQAEQMRKLERRLLPEDMEYDSLAGIRLEAREKLKKIRPRSVGQAARRSGVTPADISVLLIYLERQNRKEALGDA